MRQVTNWIKVGVCGLALAASATAAENAVLKNGFAIRHEHRQVNGSSTRLFLDAGDRSFVDVASTDIEKFEKVEEVVTPIILKAEVPTKPDLKALVKDASA